MAVAKAKSKDKLSGIKKAIMMNHLLLNRREFVVSDIETSGLSPDKGGRIIEVAGVKIVDGKEVDRFQQLIYPEQKIYQKTTDLTGITNEMLQGQPVFGQVLPKFYQWIGNATVVFHNAMFDWDRFLSYFFKACGIIAKNEVIDTLVLSKYYFPDREKWGLGELSQVFNLDLSNHHRALADSEATGRLLMHYLQHYAEAFAEKNGIWVPEGSVQMEELPPIPEQIDLFGQHVSPKTSVEESKPEPVVETTTAKPSESTVIRNNFKIKRISYWEKDITKQKKYQRIYVMLSVGNVYFDIPSKTWYNKDVPSAIDLDSFHQFILAYLQMTSVEELCNFRGSK